MQELNIIIICMKMMANAVLILTHVIFVPDYIDLSGNAFSSIQDPDPLVVTQRREIMIGK